MEQDIFLRESRGQVIDLFPEDENRETEVSGFRFFSSGWCFCEKIIGETFGFLDYFLISGGTVLSHSSRHTQVSVPVTIPKLA